MTRKTCLLALLGAFLASSPGATSLAGPLPTASEGRRNAIEDCSACHRVTASQRPPPLVPNPDEAITVQAPPFDLIARRYADRPGALRDFIRAPRHPMREQQFLPEELESLTKYIASLRNKRW